MQRRFSTTSNSISLLAQVLLVPVECARAVSARAVSALFAFLLGFSSLLNWMPTAWAQTHYSLGRPDQEMVRLLNKAVNLMRSQRAQEAIPLFEQALTRYPHSAEIHFELGNAFSDTRDYLRAIDEYQTALKLKPSLPEAILNIGFSYVNQGRDLEAIPWFHRYLRENQSAPNAKDVEAELLMAHAKCLMKDRHYFDAKQTLERAARCAPQSSRVYFSLARARDELGDSQGAIRAYQEVLRIKPQHPQAVFNIAGCYQSMGNLSEAIKWFQKYVTLYPNAPDAVQVRSIISALSEKAANFTSDPQKADYSDAVCENGKFFRWPRERLPIKVFVDSGDMVEGFKPEFRFAFFEALNAWVKASQNRLHYVLVDRKEDADMTCEWTGNPHEVKPTGHNVEQGICMLKSVDRGRDSIEIDRADIRILTIDRSTQQPLSDDEMKKTCLHELGHAMGLQGHSTNNHDIMFFAMSSTVWPVISKRDKATLFRIYQYYPALASMQ